MEVIYVLSKTKALKNENLAFAVSMEKAIENAFDNWDVPKHIWYNADNYGDNPFGVVDATTVWAFAQWNGEKFEISAEDVVS